MEIGRDVWSWDDGYHMLSEPTGGHRVRLQFMGAPLGFDHEWNRGALRARLKMLGVQQLDWPECYMTSWSIDSDLRQTAAFEAGEVVITSG